MRGSRSTDTKPVQYTGLYSKAIDCNGASVREVYIAKSSRLIARYPDGRSRPFDSPRANDDASVGKQLNGTPSH